MIKAVVSFSGDKVDDFGMPMPYHSYLIVATPWRNPGTGAASIVPLSLMAPKARDHVFVVHDGERGAFEAAVKEISRQPGNQSLQIDLHEDRV